MYCVNLEPKKKTRVENIHLRAAMEQTVSKVKGLVEIFLKEENVGRESLEWTPAKEEQLATNPGNSHQQRAQCHFMEGTPAKLEWVLKNKKIFPYFVVKEKETNN